VILLVALAFAAWAWGVLFAVFVLYRASRRRQRR
jgi:hypothetical protein